MDFLKRGIDSLIVKLICSLQSLNLILLNLLIIKNIKKRIKNIMNHNQNVLNRPQTEFYAKEKFINMQRVIAISLLAVGIITSIFFPPAGMVIFGIGCGLIGTSLIQQVIGNAEGCQKGRIKRIAAGVFFMIGAPLFGSLFWFLSDLNNRRALRIA